MQFPNLLLCRGEVTKILNLRAEQTHNHSDDFNEKNHQLNNDIRNT